LKKYFLSNYFLVVTPLVPTEQMLMESLQKVKKAKIEFNDKLDCLVCECEEGEPTNMPMQGIAWYPFIAGIQPKGYYGEN
jgi:hypothetical protein